MTTAGTRDLDQEAIRALLERVRHAMSDDDYQTIAGLIHTLADVTELAKRQGVKIRDFTDMLFPRDERSSQVLPSAADATADTDHNTTDDTAEASSSTDAGADQTDPETPKKKRKKGHGRRKAADYTGATRRSVPLTDLQAGQDCPECDTGTLYRYRPAPRVRITGTAPFNAVVTELEQLRCHLCGRIFTASDDDTDKTEKYATSAISLLIILHYATGLPFARIASLQESVGVPLPTGTQWMLIKKADTIVRHIDACLREQAANAGLIHVDDTGNRIQAVTSEKKRRAHRAAANAQDDTAADSDPPNDKAVHTTATIARTDDSHWIAVYDTGQRIARENLQELLNRRHPNAPPPILMADALNHNDPDPKNYAVQRASCLVHGRRQCVKNINNYPEKCTHVILEIAKIYHIDQQATQMQLSDQQRLLHHQHNSKPILDKLRSWIDQQFEDRLVEPNSELGKALTYLTKHWAKMTLFLTVSGAPLDNNICERGIKPIIRLRNNSLFFKNHKGAEIGDRILGLLHTCQLNSTDPLRYCQALLDNPTDVALQPERWLPWNYEQALTNKNEHHHHDPAIAS